MSLGEAVSSKLATFVPSLEVGVDRRACIVDCDL